MEKPGISISFMCNCDLCINMYPKKEMIYCSNCEKLVCPKCWDEAKIKCRDCKK